ncbi:MAG TPA: VWA domain-containing protein [Rhodoblastus sp.]|nr:VWA domain-containing protein [Rhodoblastus sp.]
MTQILSDFIRALRAQDVRISPAEAIEAGAALELLGYEDRQILKQGLSNTLAKSVDEKAAFDETFDKYFEFRAFSGKTPAGAPDAQQSRDDAAPDAEGDPGGEQGQGGEGGPPTGGGSGQGQGQASAPADQSAAEAAEADLIDILERGDRAELQRRLAEAARRAGVTDIRFFTQRGMYGLKIQREMGSERLDDLIAEARDSVDPAQQSEGARLAALREILRAEVRDYVERQLQLFAANAGRRLREEILESVRLSAVERTDMKLMHELVRKMAKRLVSLHSRRKKTARRGQLDVRRTIRVNIEYDGLLFHTIWKKRKVDRPKVMAICDVSGSVAQVSRFLLMFLYSLHDVIPNVRSFAFSGQLGEVTDLFEREEIDRAIAETLDRFGGSTDYGEAFETFESLALDEIDRKTTVLILGDARNNNAEPRADILRKIHDRARRVIFLNPEPRTAWNSGDSVMRVYEPCVDRAIVCASLKDLERVVSDLLRTAV